MRITWLLAAFLLAARLSPGQTIGNTFEYGKEITWGVTKATNSGLIGGFLARMSIRRTDQDLHYFGFEMVNVKHPKEERYYSFTGNTYIYGKTNYLYNIRAYYGRDWTLFRKATQQGVQVDGILAGGPTIGVVAPYYIEYLVNDEVIKIHPDLNYKYLNSDINRDYILGTGNLFQGIGQSGIAPGLNAKAALSFEFGSVKYSVIGIETGFMLEIFAQKIPIVPTAEQFNIFPNAFISLYYGTRK
ncbi:MAG TPA: hypothetical protein VI583_00660 [Cyclobacteriaceae bacterium]|nr:hypothetical protein [Cyclobacteriaceae bacterium]